MPVVNYTITTGDLKVPFGLFSQKLYCNLSLTYDFTRVGGEMPA